MGQGVGSCPCTVPIKEGLQKVEKPKVIAHPSKPRGSHGGSSASAAPSEPPTTPDRGSEPQQPKVRERRLGDDRAKLREERSEAFSEPSSVSSQGSSAYEDMTKEQRAEAKRRIQEFVKSMVKGKQLHVILTSGHVHTVVATLSRKLDVLKIKAKASDKQGRQIPLSAIDEILVGADACNSEVGGGFQTPLDDLSVTLALNTQECITFRMPDLKERDALVMCFTMFSTEARRMGG
mmetsp:Transcript_47322/g.95538  ORF Transcript_47322/g.95538 Transcript_47322/m.95538 type:complete len:235 (-) Transcript_47322:170-874(-)